MSEKSRIQVKPSRASISAVSRGSLQRKCACGTHTAGEQCDSCAGKSALLQRKAITPDGSSEVPRIVNEVLRSPGRPLDADTRRFFEPLFGHDFSHVRVHTDTQAAKSARAVNALAYTAARDVVFGEGQYLPRLPAGRKLLAHELTHVMQQRSDSVSANLSIGPANTSYEREADQAANVIISSHHSQYESPHFTKGTPQVQRALEEVEAEDPDGIHQEQPPSVPEVVKKPPCEDSSKKKPGKSETKNISPWQEGWDWLTGQHEPIRYFGSGDLMTEQLRNHEAVVEGRANATRTVKEACAKDSNSAEVSDEHGINYELKGIEGIGKYFRDYSTLATVGLTGNLTATFLGSYHGCWNAHISCCAGKALIHFHITNKSGLTSATHLPVLGYDRPRPTVSDWVTNPIGTGERWGATLPGSIVGEKKGEGPMSTVEQIFDWEEPVFFSPPTACLKSPITPKNQGAKPRSGRNRAS